MGRKHAHAITYSMLIILTGTLLSYGAGPPRSDAGISPPTLLLATTAATSPRTVHAASDPELPRDFQFSTPLFAPDSAWNQTVTQAVVSATSDQQILVTYRVLRGDTTDLHPPGLPPTTWPFPYVNYDDYTIPVFRAGAGEQSVLICDYDHQPSWPSPKFPDDQQEGGPVTVPAPAGVVRPAGPQNTDADGHLVLYDPGTFIEYDFWQATTVRNAECDSLGGGLMGTAILEAGAIDFFDVRGSGANIDTYSSARATGVPLLAGLILPEDVENGAISHSLAVAIPGLRNTNVANPSEPFPSDYFCPASTTETDFYNTHPHALAAGQRIRLRQEIVGDTCDAIDENSLAPITRMFLAALRTYGAILVDNAGGFTFYAEDIHTAVLDLSDAQVQALIGQPSLPAGKTKWQIVIETLNLELEQIPFACGPDNPDPTQATIDVANFEVVTSLYLTTDHSSRAIDPGGVATYTISVRSSGGSTASIGLVATSPSPSLTLQLVPSSVSPPGQATLTVTDSHIGPELLPGQWYVVPITATDGVTQATSVSLLVGGARIYLPVVLNYYAG